MTRGGALPTRFDPGWRLLDEFALLAEPGGAHVAAERAATVVRELDLRPALVAQIRQAIIEAAQSVAKAETRGWRRALLSVRLWIQDGCAQEDGSDARRQDTGRGHRGWGFFGVEKQEPDPRDAGMELRRVIEFYLYQETAHVPRPSQPARAAPDG
jgi:hypothetical protein